MHVLNRMVGTRIVSTPEAIKKIMAAQWPDQAILLRFAEDELFVTPPIKNGEAAIQQVDPHAIVVREGSFSGVWIEIAEATSILERSCEWEWPNLKQGPAFAQGMVAGLPTKLYFEEEKVLFLVSTPYAHEMEERLV